jgi:hypothetical protein
VDRQREAEDLEHSAGVVLAVSDDERTKFRYEYIRGMNVENRQSFLEVYADAMPETDAGECELSVLMNFTC